MAAIGDAGETQGGPNAVGCRDSNGGTGLQSEIIQVAGYLS